MAVFEVERAETDTEYRSPKGSAIERVEIPVYKALDELEPTVRGALGLTRATFVKVEVRGGTWTHYSEEQFQRSGREGIYTTTEIGPVRIQVHTIYYYIQLDGKVTIGHLRWDPEVFAIDKFSEGKYGKSKKNEINSEHRLADFLYQPYGFGATVTLEPIPGTDQTQPVLRYTEVRPEPSIIYPLIKKEENFEKYNHPLKKITILKYPLTYNSS